MYKTAINLVLFVVISAITTAQDNQGKNEEIPSNVKDSFEIVDPNVAKLAASDYLPSYYPGDWEYFNFETAYGLEGLPAAYVVIFRNPESAITNMSQLNKSIKDKLKELKKIQDQESKLAKLSIITEEDRSESEAKLRKMKSLSTRAMYHTSDFATVITGASEGSPIVYRCYRGLPGHLVKKGSLQDWLDKKHVTKKLKISRLIFINPLDIRYELFSKPEKNKGEGESLDMTAEKKIQLMSFSKDNPEIKDADLEKAKNREKLQVKTRQLLEMPEEHRKKIQESEKNRKLHNSSKWKKYQDTYNQGRKSN